MLDRSRRIGRRFAFVAAIAASLIAAAPPAMAQIFAATLPQARSTTVGGTVTAFASITNAGAAAAANCRPVLSGGNPAPVTLAYQTTNASNAPVGPANTSAAIAAGATQNYIFSLTANATYQGPVIIDFACDGQTAPLEPSVNDFFLVAAASAGPDIIPIAVTPSNDGVIRIGTAGGTQVMAAAAVNIGPTANVTVTPIAAGGFVPVTLSVVETTSGGAFIGGPAPSQTLSFETNTPRFFTVIATSNAGAGIPFQPDTLRVVLRFTGGGALRGQTSAALTAQGPDPQTFSAVPLGFYDVTVRVNNNTAARTGGLVLVLNPTRTLFYQIGRVVTGTPGKEVNYNQYVIPYNASFNGGPANGTMTGSSIHVFHDTNTTLLPGTSLGLDGSVGFSGNYTSGQGWFTAFQGTAALGGQYTGTATASYSALNFQNATIADAAGTWTIYDGTAETPGAANQGNFTISASGAFSGTIGGNCTVTGQLTDPAQKPDLLIVNNFGLAGAGCPRAFTATEAYMYKMGQGGVPMPPILGVPQGDYYGLVFWNLPDNGNNLYLRRN